MGELTLFLICVSFSFSLRNEDSSLFSVVYVKIIAVLLQVLNDMTLCYIIQYLVLNVFFVFIFFHSVVYLENLLHNISYNASIVTNIMQHCLGFWVVGDE